MEHFFKSVGPESCKDTSCTEFAQKQDYEIIGVNLAIKLTANGRHPFKNIVVGD